MLTRRYPARFSFGLLPLIFVLLAALLPAGCGLADTDLADVPPADQSQTDSAEAEDDYYYTEDPDTTLKTRKIAWKMRSTTR